MILAQEQSSLILESSKLNDKPLLHMRASVSVPGAGDPAVRSISNIGIAPEVIVDLNITVTDGAYD